MAESPEHQFLSQVAVDYFNRATSTRLFTMLESERKRFDFTCTVMRDWSRPIVGQVLWRHVEGADKDLRFLLLDPEAEICVYVAAATTKAQRLVSEIVGSYRTGPVDVPLYKLKTIWVPPDLDIDNESDRIVVTDLIENTLAQDVLLNVVLGNLSQEHIALFTASSGLIGLDLAVLHVVATEGFFNLRILSERLERSAGALRERITRLLGCGFLTQPDPSASYFHAALRGRVFLELCREVSSPLAMADLETRRLMFLLGLADRSPEPTRLGLALLSRVEAARREYAIEPGKGEYVEFWESPAWPPGLLRPSGFHDAESRDPDLVQ